MLEPRLVLLDEPAGGVNPSLLGRLTEVIREPERARRRLPGRRAQHPAGARPVRPRRRVLARHADRRGPSGADPRGPGRARRLPRRRLASLAGQWRRRDRRRTGWRSLVLNLSGVVAGYGGGNVLQGVDLHCADATITCIVGPNGAGKSTVLRVISGLLRPSSGEIVMDGHEVHRMGPDEVLRRGITQVPQSHALFPSMSVEENVLMGGYLIRRDRKPAGRAARPGAHPHPDRRRPVARQRRQPLGRSAPHGRDRPLPDARPEGDAARRAVARPRSPQPRRRGRPGARACTRPAPRCCWSSRTCGSASAWPRTASSWRVAGCASPARRPRCATTPRSPRCTSAAAPPAPRRPPPRPRSPPSPPLTLSARQPGLRTSARSPDPVERAEPRRAG
nr:ATP-binding cassette domain-containing protein [Angustibacter aerolatus]